MEDKIPDNVKKILQRLEQNGHEAYIVGGGIRDILLGKTPKDFDIATSAEPEEVKRIFSKTIDLGIRHGTVIVMIRKKGYEVTTFKRSSTSTWGTSIYEDLSKRDLTINAIAYHVQKGMIDPYEGRLDLQNCILKTVGNPEKRFLEDPLRILRTIRFAAQLDFHIQEETKDAMKNNALKLKEVSVERIREECTQILHLNPRHMHDLRVCGILKVIMPEVDACYGVTQAYKGVQREVFSHTIEVVSNVKNDVAIRWAALLHDIGKAVTQKVSKNENEFFDAYVEHSVVLARKVLLRFKFDTATLRHILLLIKVHGRELKPEKKNIKMFLREMGREKFLNLIDLKFADDLDLKNQDQAFNQEKIKEIVSLLEEIEENHECTSLSGLAVSGVHLKAWGVAQGPAIGRMLEYLLDRVIDVPEHNTKERLHEYVLQYNATNRKVSGRKS